ncbi:MAG: peptidylprolyl isomerase [Chloroflexi bacterium]|nr:peptidylprolyl isomerase [Chloroflexota bacterium]
MCSDICRLTERCEVFHPRFAYLASRGFDGNITCQRVVENLAAQTRDPSGTVPGGPGHFISDEFAALSHDKPGIVSMVSNADNSGGSQFFITGAPTPWPDGVHTVFGEVTSGLDVIVNMPARDPNAAPSPGVQILGIDIIPTLRA